MASVTLSMGLVPFMAPTILLLRRTSCSLSARPGAFQACLTWSRIQRVALLPLLRSISSVPLATTGLVPQDSSVPEHRPPQCLNRPVCCFWEADWLAWEPAYVAVGKPAGQSKYRCLGT